MTWKPSKEEIEEWLTEKEDEFVQKRPRIHISTSNDGNKGTSI
jgi:hypothetical protein